MNSWPLVGRTAQLERVRGLFSQRTRGQSVVLAGPAGAGKTRLATELLGIAADAGWATSRVTATRAASELPLGAFAPLLPIADDGPASGLFDLLRRSVHAVTHHAEGRPFALLVDDAQLLDDVSATLTHQLVSTGGVFVVATLRSGERAPDAVTALWKDGLAVRLDLPPLRADEIETLLTSTLGGPVDSATLHYLASHSEGNPLFLRELVLSALDSGVLQDSGGNWQLSAPIHASSRLVELVESRLRDVSRDERNVLDIVAFVDSIGVALLTQLADASVVEALEVRGLIAVSSVGRRLEARMAHPLYGDILRQRMGAVRLYGLRRSLADAVEAAGARRREDVLRVAKWRVDSGGSMSGDFMLRAAEQARVLCDFELARRLAHSALEATGGFEAAFLVAQLLNLSGRCREAEQALARLWARASDDTERGRVAVLRIDNLLYGLESPDRALGVAEEAEAAITEQSWRDEIATRRIGPLRVTSQIPAAVELATSLLERVTGRAEVWACVATATAYTTAGQIEAALAVSRRGTAAHLALDGPPLGWHPVLHVWSHAYALSSAGRLAEAEEVAMAEHERGLEDGTTHMRISMVWELSRISRMQGRVKTSERWAREAVSFLRRSGWPNYLLGVCLAELAHALALRGLGDEAAAALAEIDPRSAGPHSVFWASVAEARVWTAVAQGDLAGARASLEAIAQRTRAGGDVLIEAQALHDLARMGARPDPARLAELAARSDSPLIRAQADHAAALASRNGHDLLAASMTFERLGTILLAAEAATEAAAALREAGEARAAMSSENRATALREHTEEAVTPVLTAGPTRPVLTRREIEIARLAAAGKSNREIADQLYLSVRTVENQLQRVYEKLGVSGRRDLAAALE